MIRIQDPSGMFVIMPRRDLETLTVLDPHLAGLAVERAETTGRSVRVLAGFVLPRRCARAAAWCGGGCTAVTSGSSPVLQAVARKYSFTCRPAGSSAGTTPVSNRRSRRRCQA